MKEIEKVNKSKLESLKQELSSALEDSVVPIDWDDDTREEVMGIMRNTSITKARTASIPLICRGSACPASHSCPLYQRGIHPLSKTCPIEAKLVYELMITIAEELDVDPESTLEMGMVRDVVDQEIQQLRKQNLLSVEDIIQENVVGVDESGDPIMKIDLHLAVTWEDKIHKRKAALLKQLVATRESRIKAGAQIASDAVTMSKVLEEYQRYSQNSTHLARVSQLTEAEKEVDDYIEAASSELEGE